MPFSIIHRQDSQILRLEGTVTIRDAQDLAAMLLSEGLEETTLFLVDTANLVDIDTSILQLLCALRKSVPALSLDPPSNVFKTAVERCGLRRQLLGTRHPS